ncbi:cytochrome b/b6 domain-containing protein [Chloroflexota bacterium]
MAISGLKKSNHPLRFRILHEIIMASILLLILTGFYTHRPFVGGGGFLMSLTQGVHFFAAGTLIIAAVLRILGMFIGRTKDWRSFAPTASDLKLLPRVINHYAYIGKEPEIKKKYNPLQMITYCLVFAMIIFQIISGFALKYPDSWISWFNYSLFNNEIEVRMAHYVVNWLFVIFIMVHVYLTIREKFHEIKVMHLFSKEENEPATEE